MNVRVRSTAAGVLLACLSSSLVSAEEALGPAKPSATAAPKVPPTKAQTEQWLQSHVEAWDEGNVSVTVRDCRIVVLNRDLERSDLVDLRGALLPFEPISLKDSKGHATIRIRVKSKNDGVYAMSRKCTQQNRFCADANEKYAGVPFVDLTVTYYASYLGSSQLTEAKVARLVNALEHYSKLCGADEDPRDRLF